MHGTTLIWKNLPIFEPGLKKIVKNAEVKFYFSTEVTRND